MQASVAAFRTAREFALPVQAVYAHWIDPEARRRWEAGPDTGMVYDRFDIRPGGTETVRIVRDGEEVGQLIQTHHRVEENRLIASSMVGAFDGEVTMLTALVVEFSATDTGCRIEAVVQAMDLTGRDIAASQEAGWSWILDRFEADLAAHGPGDTPETTPREAG